MTKKLLFVMTILLVVTCVAIAADVSGKWSYEQAGRGGGPGMQVTITLKPDGAKLSGSIPGFGRGGGDPPPPTEISNGKVDVNNVYFEVKRQGQNGETITKYEGTVEGDSMKLKITRPGRGGDPQTTEVTAKKAGS
jgi:hypothetical protein